MPTSPLDLDAFSLADLKRLITQLLVRVAALEDENKALRAENARLKALPARPKLAPGGMGKATEPEKRAPAKAARRQKRKVRGGGGSSHG
jgi:cell division protein FtsB